MNNRIRDRLAELEQEQESGYQALADLDARAAALKSQMLRINGAIQVLRELLAETGSEAPGEPAAPARPRAVAG